MRISDWSSDVCSSDLQPELIQTIGQRDGGDAPALLGAENLVDAADIGNSGNQIGVGNQKRRGELIGFGLRFPTLRPAVAMEDQVREFLRCIEPAEFRRLEGVPKNEGMDSGAKGVIRHAESRERGDREG